LKPSPFILVVLGVSALVLVALVQLSEILLPFVLGFTLAYFLDPLADRLERAGLPRLVATNVITFAFRFRGTGRVGSRTASLGRRTGRHG
jgi:predicted PurR-regulated permease PerM